MAFLKLKQYMNVADEKHLIQKALIEYTETILRSGLLLSEDNDIVEMLQPFPIILKRSNKIPILLPLIVGSATLTNFHLGNQRKLLPFIFITAAPLGFRGIKFIYEKYFYHKYKKTLTNFVDYLAKQSKMNKWIKEYMHNRQVSFHLLNEKLRNTDLYNLIRKKDKDFIEVVNFNLVMICKELQSIITVFSEMFSIGSSPYSFLTSLEWQSYLPQNNSFDELLKDNQDLLDYFTLFTSNVLAFTCVGLSTFIQESDQYCSVMLNKIFPVKIAFIKKYMAEIESRSDELLNNCELSCMDKDPESPPTIQKPSFYMYALTNYLNLVRVNFDMAHGLMELLVNNSNTSDFTVQTALIEISQNHKAIVNSLDVLVKSNARIVNKINANQNLNEHSSGPNGTQLIRRESVNNVRFDDPPNLPEQDEEYILTINANDNVEELDTMDLTPENYEELVRMADMQKMLIQELQAKLDAVNLGKGRNVEKPEKAKPISSNELEKTDANQFVLPKESKVAPPPPPFPIHASENTCSQQSLVSNEAGPSTLMFDVDENLKKIIAAANSIPNLEETFGDSSDPEEG